MTKSVLLITGQLRNFSRCIDYLVNQNAFSNYFVRLSTWSTSDPNSIELLQKFETLGGVVIKGDPLDNGSWTSITAQKFTLFNGLSGLDNRSKVLKTRSDWLVDHDLLNLISPERISSFDKEKIMIHGFVPTIPYFINDGHFAGTVQKIKSLSNLDFTVLQRFPDLHAEQLFFLPPLSEMSEALVAWLRHAPSTQFDQLRAAEWKDIRCRSHLFGYVVGEFLRFVNDHIEFIQIDKLGQISKPESFESILFGDGFGAYSDFTSITHWTGWNYEIYQMLIEGNHELSRALRMGYEGSNPSVERLSDWITELSYFVDDASVELNLGKPGGRQYQSELAHKDSEISLLRRWIASFTGTGTP